jgi:hypothetical protein
MPVGEGQTHHAEADDSLVVPGRQVQVRYGGRGRLGAGEYWHAVMV